MLNSELVRKAHEMTSEIKTQYPEVDYRFQYGLCLSYLLNEEKSIDLEKELKEIADKKRLYFAAWSGKYQKKYGFYDYNTKEYSTFDRYTKNYSILDLK